MASKWLRVALDFRRRTLIKFFEHLFAPYRQSDLERRALEWALIGLSTIVETILTAEAYQLSARSGSTPTSCPASYVEPHPTS
jgi:hypothetical protein